MARRRITNREFIWILRISFSDCKNQLIFRSSQLSRNIATNNETRLLNCAGTTSYLNDRDRCYNISERFIHAIVIPRRCLIFVPKLFALQLTRSLYRESFAMREYYGAVPLERSFDASAARSARRVHRFQQKCVFNSRFPSKPAKLEQPNESSRRASAPMDEGTAREMKSRYIESEYRSNIPFAANATSYFGK